MGQLSHGSGGTGSDGRCRLNQEGVQLSPLHMLRAQGHVTVAKLIVGLKSLLSLVWHLQIHSRPGSMGIHGATEAASPQNSKLSPM